MRSQPLKVLMLGWEFPPIINGGLGIACHDLSKALSRLVSITMIIPKSSPGYKMENIKLIGLNNLSASQLEQLPPYTEDTQFPVHEIPANLNPYYSDKALSAPGSSASSSEISGKLHAFNIDSLYGGDVIRKVHQFADLTAALALKMDFDIIHAHDWMTMIAGMRIKHLTGKKLVMHIHSLEVDRGGPESRGWVYDLEKKGMEYADLLIPVSQFTADNIRTYYGISQEKIKVVHNGSNNVTPFRSHRPFGEKTVLFVGRLTRQKGPEKFVEIAARVLQRNSNVRFVMAGVGDSFTHLIEKSAYQHLGNRFHMTGFLNLEKLRRLLSISDVYCMPSVSEPFGLSAIEAAQFGIPCVISKQSGVSEVLTGSLKFDFWDVNKASDYILSLLEDEVLKEKVVADAYRDLEKVSWDISAGKVMNAYSGFIMN